MIFDQNCCSQRSESLNSQLSSTSCKQQSQSEESSFTDFTDSEADQNYTLDQISENDNSDKSHKSELEEMSENYEHEVDIVEEIISKKRKCNPENWKRNNNKKLLNTGKYYKLDDGNFSAERNCGHGCNPHSCKLNCSVNLPYEERTEIFRRFWALGNKTLQLQYSKKDVVKRKYCKNTPQPKKFSMFYSLPSLKGCTHVCCAMFLSTLGISYQWIRTAHKKAEMNNGVLKPDERGTAPAVNKINSNITESVRDHIRSIPVLESHYSRKDTTRKYVDGSLNISKLYSMYLEKMAEDGTIQWYIFIK